MVRRSASEKRARVRRPSRKRVFGNRAMHALFPSPCHSRGAPVPEAAICSWAVGEGRERDNCVTAGWTKDRYTDRRCRLRRSRDPSNDPTASREQFAASPETPLRPLMASARFPARTREGKRSAAPLEGSLSGHSARGLPAPRPTGWLPDALALRPISLL